MLPPEYHELVGDDAIDIVHRKLGDFYALHKMLLEDAEGEVKGTVSQKASLEDLQAMCKPLLEYAGRTVHIGKSDKDKDYAEKRLTLMQQSLYKDVGALELGSVYLGKVPDATLYATDGWKAEITEYWLAIPKLVQKAQNEHEIAYSNSVNLMLSPAAVEQSPKWLQVRLMLDRAEGIPFPVPDSDQKPTEWSAEELALGYLQFLWWLAFPYQYADAGLPSAVMTAKLLPPRERYLERFDISARRQPREALKELFPRQLRNAVCLTPGMKGEDLLAQLCLVALRQEAASSDIYEWLVSYTQRLTGVGNSGIYATDTINHAWQHWVYPMSPTALTAYLKQIARGKMQAEQRNGREVSRVEGWQKQRPLQQDFFSVEQAAAHAGVTRQAVYKWVRAGKVEPTATDPIAFDREKLQEVMELGRQVREKRERDARIKKVAELVAKDRGIKYRSARRWITRQLGEGRSLDGIEAEL